MRDQTKEKNNQWRKDVSTKDLIQKYVNELKTCDQIAEECKCTSTLVRKRLINSNIKLRTIKETRQQVALKLTKRRNINSNKGNRKTYLEIAKKELIWKCIHCGALKTNPSFDLIVHHKDGNNRNNELSNLAVLCQRCHAREHMTARKRSKK